LPETTRIRELLFADLALTLGVTGPGEVARALERHWVGGPDDAPLPQALEAAGALTREQRRQVEREVERLVADAEGDAAIALARRGGIDRSIHASLRPETSVALLREGAGSRAPLRTLPPDRYREFTLVGKGGMGFVYLALDTELNRRVAFKMVRPDPGAAKDTPAPDTPLQATPPSEDTPEEGKSFEELRIRFLQEAWVTGAMEHPGVVPVYELGSTEAGIPYYTMRYVKGERTFATAIRAAEDLDARLALLEPFLKVCDTVRYAHARGVVHRDLKPENIALGEFGEVVVLDWGLSKMEGRPDVSGSLWRSRLEEFREATDLRTVAGALGTPGYMAPEAALGRSEEVDAQSDVYSLGALLFEILTGRLPFRFRSFMECIQKMLEETPPRADEVDEAVPADLAAICARALARRKEDRFASVDEMARELRRWLTEGPLQRQVDALVEDARAELEAARRHGGNMLLWHLDRATAACTRVLHLRRGHAEATALLGEVKGLRETGIRQRVRASRRQVIVAVGFGILALAALAALSVAKIFADQQAEAEAQMRAARDRLAAKEAEVRMARLGEEDASRRRADLYAGLSRALLSGDDVAGARLAAAQALTVAPTPAGWRALAEATARWTPTLRGLVEGVAPGPVALSPAGDELYAAAPDNRVRAWEVATGEPGFTFEGHTEPVRLLAISRNGRRLATVAGEAEGIVWDVATGRALAHFPDRTNLSEQAQLELRLANRPTALAFTSDGGRLFVGHRNGVLFEYDSATGAGVGTLIHPGAALTVIEVSPDDRWLYCGNAEGLISRREAAHLLREVSYESGGLPILDIQGAEDGGVLYAATTGNVIYLFETEEPSLLTHYEGPPRELAGVRVSRDIRRLYTADRNGAVEVWDVDAKSLLARLPGRGRAQAPLALSGDGRRLAVVGADGTARVWDLTGGWRSGEAEPVTALVQDRAGERLFLGRPDATLEVWDSAAGRRLQRLRGPTATLSALALDEDAGLLVSASLDGMLRVWRQRDGAWASEAAFRGPDHPTALALRGGDLFVGTVSGAVEAWSLPHRRRLVAFPDPCATAVARLAVEGDTLLAADALGGGARWNITSHERAAEDGPVPDLAPSPLRGTLPPILGRPEPWVLGPPLLRLIETENRLGLCLDGTAVTPVPAAQYRPHQPRIEPWSR